MYKSVCACGVQTTTGPLKNEHSPKPINQTTTRVRDPQTSPLRCDQKSFKHYTIVYSGYSTYISINIIHIIHIFVQSICS